ncbi:MAG: penicillin acylase family protein, partial [Actinomycetota bacterium]
PASNAILLSGEQSATGNPMQIGAPQVGYGAPSFFMDIDVHAPGVDFRGPAVPGASALIPLGRGRDYAWSLTTGFSDAVDVRIEKLCDPEGGEAAEDSEGYVFRGKCKKMESRDETFIAKPTPTDPAAPRVETETIYRTQHGPVIGRGEVDGKPVAFVKERFFWMRELDSIPQFYRWNTQVDSIEDFAAAARKFTMSFNAFYADADNIGYFHVGYYPRRTRGVHPALPTWGTGKWEWRGRRAYSRQPKVVNPQRGWLTNWNNKPALGWDNHDGFKWGSIQRNQLLLDGMSEITTGAGTAGLADLVDVIRTAATRDTRGVYLGPEMLDRARAANARTEQAAGYVADWVEAGAHRHNRDGDDTMDDGPALAIFDRWYDVMVHRIFDDELGAEGFELIGAPVTDYSPEGGSSFWFDFSAYVDNLFGGGGVLDYDYCDDRNSARRESCRYIVNQALDIALDQLIEEQGDDLGAWTVEAENIEFQAFGAGSVDPIPWQNRGTHNHIVEILRSTN